MNETRTFALGWSGGSGIAYGMRLLEVLLAGGHTVHLVASPAALRVLRHEAGVELDPARPDLAGLVRPELRARLHVHDPAAVEAAPSSGSAAIAAVILCPCSMGTLARVAHGFSSNLLERAADVALKEGRPLIVVPRETPLSPLHLRNMLSLAESGAVVLPAMPGFYHRPQSVQDLVDFVVAKVLDRLGVASPLIRRWATPPAPPASPWHEGEEP
ncbi:MAG: UbiX family flavin prenyltransferase [Planctomycetes bacterium]|nr:UbiX family flavin prenyltransferase [Planctomycetota bacterium]